MAHEQAMDVILPKTSDYVSMAAAFAAYFVLSFLWWGPIFGKTWGRLMGMEMNPDKRPPMTVPLLLQALGTLLLAYVLWHVMEAFAVTHTSPGELGRGKLSVASALMGAFFTWLGFYVPVQLGRVAWENASWALFGINAGGHLVGLMAMGLCFALL